MKPRKPRSTIGPVPDPDPTSRLTDAECAFLRKLVDLAIDQLLEERAKQDASTVLKDAS